MNSNFRPWLFSKRTDLIFLFVPIWLLWIFFWLFGHKIQNMELPLWAWVVFILGFDVSHVWSSLFRSYAVNDEFQVHKKKLILTPILAFALSVLIMSFSIAWFWRIMAYLAVFHFVKQQYGFLALYKLRAGEQKKRFISDKWVIYVSTIYPIIFWHFNATTKFNWFVENDFLFFHSFFGNEVQTVFQILNVFYWLFIGTWLFQEIKAKWKGEIVSTGKILWVLTTAVNWWFGIVYFNSDLIFSISNVVAHGLPYFVLIYYYGLKKKEVILNRVTSIKFRLNWFVILISTTLIAAFVEEYFWDMLINNEHFVFFEFVFKYHYSQVSELWQVVIIMALLSLPQQVHYVMDGFIWKMNEKNKFLKPLFKPNYES